MLKKNFIRIGKELVGNSELLFPILVPRFRRATVLPNSDICIAGPPRSANTFAVNVFQNWNPNSRVAHHVHLPMQVIFAVKWKVPCIVPLRHPLDVIASEIIIDPKLSLSVAIWSYLNFYNQILSVRDQVVVATFEDIVNSFHKVIARTNKKYDTSFYSEQLSDSQEQEIHLQIRENRNKLTKYPLLIAVPDPEKEEKKIIIKDSISKHHLFSKACSVYDQWVPFSNE